jgi:hypothetical protein
MAIEKDLEEIQKRQLFGAAGTDINNQLPGLGGLGQAMKIVQAMRPQQEKVDPALLSFLFFSQLAQESSKPGSTLLGAAGSAVQSPAAYLIQREEQERKAREGDFSTAVQLANLMKPKPGSYADYTPVQDLWLESGKYVSVQPADDRPADYPKGEPINLNSAERGQFPPGSLLSYNKQEIGKPTFYTFTEDYWLDPNTNKYTNKKIEGADPTYRKGSSVPLYDSQTKDLIIGNNITGLKPTEKAEKFERKVYDIYGNEKTVYSAEEFRIALLSKNEDGYDEKKSGFSSTKPKPFTSFSIFHKDGREMPITNKYQYDQIFTKTGEIRTDKSDFNGYSLTKPAPEEKPDPRKFYQITDAKGKVETKFLTDAEVAQESSKTGVSVVAAPSPKSQIEQYNIYRNIYTKDHTYKQYKDLQTNFNKVNTSYELAYKIDKPQVADLSMIFAYMKMLDPRSVVREGEQQQARATGGAADYLINTVKSLQGEGSLTDLQRKSFRDAAFEYYKDEVGNLEILNNGLNKEMDVMGYTGTRDFFVKPNKYVDENNKSTLKIYGSFPKGNLQQIKKKLGAMDNVDLGFYLMLPKDQLTQQQLKLIRDEIERRKQK